MADRTLFFDDLLRTPNLRAKSYVVQEPLPNNMACVELSARRSEDWFYARRWVSTRTGRRMLYWILDDVETSGFRFRIVTRPRTGPGGPGEAEQRWQRARANWAELSEEENRLHRELFPQEYRLLERGYDWDHAAVYRDGLPLSVDALGRCLEEDEGVVHEWVRIPEEWTWRRYPLYALLPKALPAPTAEPEPAV
ncbi:MAG: hypothetical protein HYT80_07720 [Euryarchaeota archaeon]|nr:hypothetical protein [Euryarchaeota archaeon]